MTDVYDAAQDLEQFDRDVALSNRRPEGPAARGYCLECGDESVGSSRWCSKECARDWERRQNQQLGR